MRHYRRLTAVGTPREELLALQRRRLVATARHAAAASPIYRELYAGIELAEDLDVRALPVVTKEVLMEHFDEWVTDPRLQFSQVEAHLERVRTRRAPPRQLVAYPSMASLLALEQLEARLRIAPGSCAPRVRSAPRR